MREGEIVSIFSFDICDMTEVGKSKSLSGPKKGSGVGEVIYNSIQWSVA